MTKKKKIVFLSAALILALAVLVPAVFYGSALTDPWGLRFSASNVTPEGLTLTVVRSPLAPEQKDARFLPTTGAYYFLEKKQDGAWVEVPPRANADDLWEMIAYRFPRAVRFSVEIRDLDYRYGTLPAGRYRVGKLVTLQAEDGTREERPYYAVFTLKR